MEDLPTFALKITSFVGKYTIHGASGIPDTMAFTKNAAGCFGLTLREASVRKALGDAAGRKIWGTNSLGTKTWGSS